LLCKIRKKSRASRRRIKSTRIRAVREISSARIVYIFLCRTCSEKARKNRAKEEDSHQQELDIQSYQQEHRKDYDGKSHDLQRSIQVP
jgi:predicted metal-binding protein